ncbi:MAG: 1-deoxy-D-xylulose-5-phosphate reductoisomerase, partial [Syntrophomonas sp.]
MNDLINVVILGSTGSIGEQALQVIDQHADKFRVVGLAARNEVETLCQQIDKYHPSMVAVGDLGVYNELKQLKGKQVEIVCGIKGLCELAALDEADTVVVAVSGSIGIEPTLAAIRKSKRIALANKETLVAAGDIVMSSAKIAQAMIIPVDSEHSA